MLRTSLLSSAAIVALSTSAFAQELALEEIVVSGGLSPIAAQSYGRAASVITAQQIEDRGITNVADALRSLPGVSVSSSGGQSQVRIRGGEGNHTLVLIDGVEASGGDGEYFFTGLETANVERIEVLRGPQSVYYGSNASSGVINIITKKGDIGTTYSGSLEAGSATIATAFLAHRNERGGIALSLAHTNDSGFDQSGDGGEKDGLERSSLILSSDYLVTDNLKLGFNIRRSKEEYDIDSAAAAASTAGDYVFDNPSDFINREELTGQLYTEIDTLDGRLTHRLSIEKSQNRQSFNGTSLARTESEVLKYRLSYGLDSLSVEQTNHLLNFLVESQEDTSSDNAAYSRATRSIAFEYRGNFENGIDVQGGVRFDDNEIFENAFTYNVGVVYEIPNTNLRLHGSIGKGVVNPQYLELYSDVTYSYDFQGTRYNDKYLGNPNLEPETNKSFDIGVEFPVFDGRGIVDITYFREKLTDEIVQAYDRYDPIADESVYTYENQVGDSRREGVEVSGNMQATDTVALRMSYTYLDAENPDGGVEVRRPRHELSLGATVETFGGRGSVSADVRHISGNFDTKFFGTFQTSELPSYTTVDLAADYDLNDRLTLTGRVTNLLDDDVVNVWGFASRGRSAYVGLRASF